MSYIIFSPSKGFYTGCGQWDDDPAEATEFGCNDDAQALSGQDDARFVNPKLYTQETFEEVVDRFVESLGEDLDGHVIADVASEILDAEVSYEEDSGWHYGGETLAWEDLKGHIEESLGGCERDALMHTYNGYCTNQIFLDHDGGFVHQQVL